MVFIVFVLFPLISFDFTVPVVVLADAVLRANGVDEAGGAEGIAEATLPS